MDRRLLILALGMFALGTDSFVVAGVLPEISQYFHISIGAAGQMTSAYAITYALMAPLIAAVAAHVRRKGLLLAGLAIFVVANLITAASPNFAIAMASRILAGLGAAMFAPTATGAAATLVAPEHRGYALSIVIAGLTASTALGSPIGAVIGGLGDWRWTMVFVSALAALSGVGVALLLTHIPLPPRITLAERVKPVTDARVALTLLTTWLYQSGQFVAYTYFTVVFDRAIGHDTVLVGVLLVAFGLSGTIANLFVGRLARLDRRPQIDLHDARHSRCCPLVAVLGQCEPLDSHPRAGHLGRMRLGSSGASTTSIGRPGAADCTCGAGSKYLLRLSRHDDRRRRRRSGNSVIGRPLSWICWRSSRRRRIWRVGARHVAHQRGRRRPPGHRAGHGVIS